MQLHDFTVAVVAFVSGVVLAVLYFWPIVARLKDEVGHLRSSIGSKIDDLAHKIKG